MSSLPPPPDDLPEPDGEPVAGIDHPTGAISGSWPEPPVDAASPFGGPPADPFSAPPGGAFSAPPGGAFAAPVDAGSFQPPEAPQYPSPPAAPQYPAPPGQYPASPAPQYPAPPAGSLPPPPGAGPGTGPGLPAPPGGWIQPAAYGELPPPQFPPGGPGAPYGTGYQTYRPGMRPSASYAGFWARFGAMFIDGLVVGIVPGVLYIIGIVSAPTVTVPCTTYSSSTYYGTCTEPDFAKVLPFLIAAGVLYLVLLFFVIIRPIGTTGQTIGGKATNVRVVDASTGQPIGIGRAFGRYLLAGLLGQCCYITYLWMLWDDRKQTLHDKAVSAIVVQA